MSDWKPIAEAPHTRELDLWLCAPPGTDTPIGHVIGYYTKSDFFIGWVEKSVCGNINNGLQQDLITHYRELDDAPQS